MQLSGLRAYAKETVFLNTAKKLTPAVYSPSPEIKPRTAVIIWNPLSAVGFWTIQDFILYRFGAAPDSVNGLAIPLDNGYTGITLDNYDDIQNVWLHSLINGAVSGHDAFVTYYR